MADDTCSFCGSEMSISSRYCVKCGRQRPALVADRERPVAWAPPAPPLAPPASPLADPSIERAVAEQRGPRPPRRRSLLVLGVVLALLVAAVVVLSGGDDAGDQAADEPTTTVAPSQTTRRPPRTTTTLPAVQRTQLPSVVGPVLGAPSAMSLYVLSGTNVARIEFDSGAVTIVRRAFRRSGEYNSTAYVRDGHLVVGRESSVYVLPADLSTDAVPIEGFEMDLGIGYGRLLTSDYAYEAGPEPLEVNELGLDGAVMTTWTIAAQTWPRGVVGDRLVVEAGGQVFLVAPDGRVEQHGVGQVIVTGGAHLLWRRCDEVMRCDIYVDDLVAGTSERVVGLSEPDFYFYGQSLSPDGRTAVGMGDGGERLVDVRTGETLAELDSLGQPAWSPDGAWLFTRGNGDRLLAVSTRGEPTIELELPDELSLGSDDVVLAVG